MSMDGQGVPVGAPAGPIPNPIVQTIWRGVQIHVVNNPVEKTRSLVFDLPTNQIVLPLTIELAEQLGRALSAPSIHVPQNGEGNGL